MRAPITVAAFLVAVMIFAGCGGSSKPSDPSASVTARTSSTTSPTTTTTTTTTPSKTTAAPSTEQHRVPTVEQVEISSPAFRPGAPAPVRYTCDGANTWPTLEIKGIPANTKELVLELIKEEPINGKLPVAWALAGLSPKLHRISSGKLPAGAIVGRNWYGHTKYNVCQPHKPKEIFVYVLLALPRPLHPKPGFEALAVRTEALHDAEYEGFLVFTYPS